MSEVAWGSMAFAALCFAFAWGYRAAKQAEERTAAVAIQAGLVQRVVKPTGSVPYIIWVRPGDEKLIVEAP